MPRDLGKTKEGHTIVARACGEDNSGVVFHLPLSDVYVLRTSYHEYGKHLFCDKTEAIAELRNACGVDN